MVSRMKKKRKSLTRRDSMSKATSDFTNSNRMTKSTSRITPHASTPQVDPYPYNVGLVQKADLTSIQQLIDGKQKKPGQRAKAKKPEPMEMSASLIMSVNPGVKVTQFVPNQINLRNPKWKKQKQVQILEKPIQNDS